MPIEVIRVRTDDLARRTASWLEARISDTVSSRGECHLAVSGGRSPWAAFDLLAELPLDWAALHVWQVDERIAPDGDPARNAVGIARTLGRTAATIHLMDVGGDAASTDDDADAGEAAAADAAAAAVAYAAELHAACDGVLDVLHLGLGDDGHTASWPPGDPVIDVDDVDVALSRPYQQHRRMTLTVPCVNRARRRLFLIGADKRGPLEQLLAGDVTIAASRVQPAGTTVITDAER